jgi:hypothetical protein
MVELSIQLKKLEKIQYRKKKGGPKIAVKIWVVHACNPRRSQAGPRQKWETLSEKQLK